MALPYSGPKRYDFDETTSSWVYSHDNIPLHTRLSQEISEVLGKETNMTVPTAAVDS